MRGKDVMSGLRFRGIGEFKDSGPIAFGTPRANDQSMTKPNRLRHPGYRFLPSLLAGLIAAAALLPSKSALASDSFSTPIATGTGGSSPNGYFTLGLGGTNFSYLTLANLSFDLRSLLISARASAAFGLEFFAPPEKQLNDYSFLIGKVWRGESARAYLSAGIGVADITRRGSATCSGDAFLASCSYEMVQNRTVNIPLQVGFSWDSSLAGIGLALVGNLNQDLPSYGSVLTVSLGKLHEMLPM